MAYLLGANSVLDLCFDNTPTSHWIKTVRHTDCKISVIAIGIAINTIETMSADDLVHRDYYMNTLASRLATLCRTGNEPLVVDEDIARSFAQWRSVDLRIETVIRGEYAMGVEEFQAGMDTRLIIATAWSGHYELVEPREAYHYTLIQRGMRVLSL